MNKLKLIRESRKIKQDEMARLLNISPSNYFKKEIGSIRFSLIEAKKIAEFFNTTIDELFFEN